MASEYGSVSIYGYDSRPFYQLNPTEQFLSTDFVEFRIEAETMRALAVSIDFEGDINNHPRGLTLNIKGEAYPNQITVDREAVMKALFHPQDPIHHSSDPTILPEYW